MSGITRFKAKDPSRPDGWHYLTAEKDIVEWDGLWEGIDGRVYCLEAKHFVDLDKIGQIRVKLCKTLEYLNKTPETVIVYISGKYWSTLRDPMGMENGWDLEVEDPVQGSGIGHGNDHPLMHSLLVTSACILSFTSQYSCDISDSARPQDIPGAGRPRLTRRKQHFQAGRAGDIQIQKVQVVQDKFEYPMKAEPPQNRQKGQEFQELGVDTWNTIHGGRNCCGKEYKRGGMLASSHRDTVVDSQNPKIKPLKFKVIPKYNEDFAWDPHACRDNNTPPYVTNEDVDLDGPDDNVLEQEDICINRELRSLSAAIDADEWLPKGQKWKLESQGGRPKTYIKGPDVVSKSERMQHRYKKQITTQGTLNFLAIPQACPIPPPIYVPSQSPSPDVEINSGTRSLSPNELAEGDMRPKQTCAIKPTVEDSRDMEDDEDKEINELMQGHALCSPLELPDWPYLRNEIDKVLDKEKKVCHLPYSQLNQYQLLHSFATLQIKGLGRIAASIHIALSQHKGEGAWFARRICALACHFEKYEQLPIECRGGRHKGSCHLDDEDVNRAARSWLEMQKIGSVTSSRFCRALNATIFPNLGIALKKPLSNRMACVYMDGHEREDVIHYRNDIFLPTMAKFESHMACYEGEDLKRHEPNLQPGEKRIIVQFHDESCFHANEFKSSAWLKQGQSILQKKSWGCLIHVSDFINEEDGRLIQHNVHGKVIRDARKALFIFDQSSAHASLRPDALRAFDMNKGNGGKQRKQKDTIIPCTNPTISMHGKPQKMTNENGEAKGLQAVLEEHGFDMKGMRAKCTPYLNPIEMYWGYAKYRYCEVFKATFAEAKQTTIQSLDACPVETIRHFINRSWRFMSAYHLGLMGKAAEWAVSFTLSNES
ncbi:hypothetical protein BS47DRAFT_1364327 [Hydnum rufescens UP504]|uniref:Uncharacterized protein n=1 Tax=Hydnum rufescens UP504 TaxID=1448309 RepID=A0A9P6ARW3_9AGAM|nr:hypothetical protein BS47DRAFT_1364327 [Hydnum rufescens UP504]